MCTGGKNNNDSSMTLNLKNRLLIIISLKFGLNSFWVEAVTKVGSSSLDASEPLPLLNRFPEGRDSKRWFAG